MVRTKLRMAALAAASGADCSLRAGVTPMEARSGTCGFDAAARSFQGTPAEQARCLTRHVGRGATLGDPTLAQSFTDLLPRPVGADATGLRGHLAALGANETDLGGPLGRPVVAAYFIIHDTSTPNCSDRAVPRNSCPVLGELPAARDMAAWRDHVTFQGHPKLAPNRIANVFVNRVGGSITEVDFADAFYTAKFEQCVKADAKRGLFVGVENIQPRIGSPAVPQVGKKANDLVAPTPGFTPAQYDRLALAYVVASVRRGAWLIPAFHAVLDARYRQGHDDPQNFDMAAFAAAVERHRAALEKHAR